LASKGYAEVDLLVVEAKTPAAGDYDGAVVERVVRFRDAARDLALKLTVRLLPASRRAIAVDPMVALRCE
jgi:hypothetical protein